MDVTKKITEKKDRAKFIRGKSEKISPDDLHIIKSMAGALFSKGISVVTSIFMLPLYITFFKDKTVLGLWYTMLAVLNWVNLFDLGLGNGLRNKLPVAIENKDIKYAKSLISTTYALMSIVAGLILLIGEIEITKLNWNRIFNIESSVMPNSVLVSCVQMVFGGVVVNIVLRIINSILYAMQYSTLANFLSSIPNIIMVIALYILQPNSSEKNLRMISVTNVLALNIPYILCTVIVFRHILRDSAPSLSFFRKECVKDICNIGISILWLQLVFMVISSTNEPVITVLTSADYVTEYQVYYKIFGTIGMAFSLMLTPVWSAVTKAQAQKRYLWIRKIYKNFLMIVFMCILVEVCIIPLIPKIINIWVGKNTIKISLQYVIVFICSSAMFVLHSVNTAVGNGLSYFKVQMIWMTFAAVIFIPFAYILVQKTGSWIGVIIANVIALMPYEFMAPAFIFKMLDRKSERQSNDE